MSHRKAGRLFSPDVQGVVSRLRLPACSAGPARTLPPTFAMWTTGPNTLSAGQSQRWYFSFGEGDPGLQVIGVHPITPGSEVEYTTPGVKLRPTCGLTYYLTVRNVGSSTVTYYFRGTAI